MNKPNAMSREIMFSQSHLRMARDEQKKAGISLGKLSTYRNRCRYGNPSFEIYSSTSPKRGSYVAIVHADNAYIAKADYILSMVEIFNGGTPCHNVQLADTTK